MNLKGIAQITFLFLSSTVIASTSILFFALQKRPQFALIPLTNPANALFFKEKKITIGRSEESDVYILDESISSLHSEIFYKKGRYFVRDLNSKNGTFVNNQPVILAEIHDGDLLTFGTRNFIFKTGWRC